MLRAMVALFGALVLMLGTLRPSPGQDSSAGFAEIEPSIVRIFASDAAHTPRQFGSGFVVWSDDKTSLILTAKHVVDGLTYFRVQPFGKPEADAKLQARGSVDVALLSLPVGKLRPVTFAARTRQAAVGYRVAVAGFIDRGDFVRDARLRFADVSSLPGDGALMELASGQIESGMSGGPVFDPVSGDVYGLMNTQNTTQQGGYALAGAFTLLPFLETTTHLAMRIGSPSRQVAAASAPPAAPAAPTRQATAAAQPTRAPQVVSRAQPASAAAPIFSRSTSIAVVPETECDGCIDGRATQRMTSALEGAGFNVADDARTADLVISVSVSQQDTDPGRSTASTTLAVTASWSSNRKTFFRYESTKQASGRLDNSDDGAIMRSLSAAVADAVAGLAAKLH